MFNFEVNRWMYFLVIGLSIVGTIMIELKIDRIGNCQMQSAANMLQSVFSKNDDAEDVYHPGIHIPLARQYPLEERKVKVDLIVGIICIPEPYHRKNCKEAINSALEELKADKSITVEVYVGILSQNEEDWRSTTKSFDDMITSVRIRFITLSTKRLQRRMDNKDLDVLDHKFHASFMKRMAAVNMLLGLMHWHAAHEGKYFWHLEANTRAKKGALKSLKDYRKMLEDWNKWGYRVNTLYDINSSKDLANHLYFMGPYGTFYTMQTMFMQYKGGALQERGSEPPMLDKISLDKPKTSIENPPATFETNLGNIDGDPALITDPYKKGAHWCGKGANNETYLHIKFDHTLNIKRIVIETGFDIYQQYPILLAILRKANDIQNGVCKTFKRIGDFRQGQIDLTFDETPLDAACLEIRWVEKEKQDVCLNSINIYT